MKTVLPGVTLRKLDVYRDSRGWLVEFLRSTHMEESSQRLGQIYMTVASPGQKKGGHYHNHKREGFCVLRGTCRIHVRVMETAEESFFDLSEKELFWLRIEPGVAHLFENVGEGEMALLIYSDTLYDEKNPDSVNYEFNL